MTTNKKTQSKNNIKYVEILKEYRAKYQDSLKVKELAKKRGLALILFNYKIKREVNLLIVKDKKNIVLNKKIVKKDEVPLYKKDFLHRGEMLQRAKKTKNQAKIYENKKNYGIKKSKKLKKLFCCPQERKELAFFGVVANLIGNYLKNVYPNCFNSYVIKEDKELKKDKNLIAKKQELLENYKECFENEVLQATCEQVKTDKLLKEYKEVLEVKESKILKKDCRYRDTILKIFDVMQPFGSQTRIIEDNQPAKYEILRAYVDNEISKKMDNYKKLMNNTDLFLVAINAIMEYKVNLKNKILKISLPFNLLEEFYFAYEDKIVSNNYGKNDKEYEYYKEKFYNSEKAGEILTKIFFEDLDNYKAEKYATGEVLKQLLNKD